MWPILFQHCASLLPDKRRCLASFTKLKIINSLNFGCSENLCRPLIVDKIHLHLFPSRNSDGFAVAKPGPTRNNAHNVYLNRDFPDQVLHPDPLQMWSFISAMSFLDNFQRPSYNVV